MEPISTRGWTIEGLLARGKRFRAVPRISCTSQGLEGQIEQHEKSGTPYIIEGWHQQRWPGKIFDIEFCRRYFQDKNEKIRARNVHTRVDKNMPFGDFLTKSRLTSSFAEPGEAERWYGKDVECPRQWEEWLMKDHVLPEKFLPGGKEDLFAYRPKKNERPDIETLMCYFGVGDTYTPCHKDLCASSGQNLMCYTENGGSSFWFMTRSRDCAKVTKHLRGIKHELDHETHVISVADLAAADFDVFIAEQRLGDLVLVPPRSCHQVVNSGGLTVKMSWSRMTLPGLTAALYHELPLYRRVCRPEIYQIKSTIHYALVEYTRKLRALSSRSSESEGQSALAKNLRAVLRLYDHILIQECSSVGPGLASSKLSDSDAVVAGAPLPLAVDFHTCDFCGADIFQNYFQCLGTSAKSAGERNFIVCPGCYVEGRTCACAKMRERERQSIDVLFAARWRALQTLLGVGISIKGFKGIGSLKDQKRYFAQPSESSVFHAAMLLHQIRLAERQTSKQCRMKGDSHSVPASWAIPCKKCHASRCYPHLMDGTRMHSMRALLLADEDKTSGVYHEGHKTELPDYHQGKKDLISSQMEGTPFTDFNTQLVYNVQTHPYCQPINAEHASLGWYDQQRTIAGKRAAPVKTKEETAPMNGGHDEVQATTQVSGSESQRGQRNHAYVELKQPEQSRRASGDRKKPQFSSPLSSPNEGGSERDELISDSDDMPIQRNTATSKRKRRANKDTESSSEDEKPPQRKDSQPKLSPPRGVKKPLQAKMSARIKSPKDEDTHPPSPPPFLVGPPKKKRRQEPEKISSPSSSNAPNEFAFGLEAALNQVAETATTPWNHRVEQEHRKRGETGKSRQVEGSPPQMAGSNSQHSRQALTQAQTSPTPIVVNVADLQDMVVKTADQVVRQMIGNVPTLMLTAHAAVSMMTGYAANGQFMENNSQLQFPSMNHFAGVMASTQTNANNATTSQAQGSATTTRDQPQSRLSTTTSRETVDDNLHHHLSKDRDRDTQSSYHQSRAKPEGRAQSARPDRRPLPPALRKMSSSQGVRRRIETDEDDQ